MAELDHKSFNPPHHSPHPHHRSLTHAKEEDLPQFGKPYRDLVHVDA